MLLTLGRRALGALPVLFALVAVVFTLQKIAPVDPVVALVGDKAPPEVYEAARERLGLNDPLPVQFASYIGRALQGDLGISSVTRTQVTENIIEFLPVTLELIFVAMIFIAIVGVFLGLATARGWRGSGVLRVVMISGASVPVFLACIMAMLVFYRWLGVLPVTGQTASYDAPAGPTRFLLIDSLIAGRPALFVDALKHLILPAVCIALAPAVAVGRVLRSSLEGTQRAEYTRTARAKGLSENRILIMHALRNAIGPVFALLGLQLAAMIGNSILVEMIFARPGLGLFLSQAIYKGDFNTIAGVTLVIGSLYVFANIAVDVLQAAADPRVAV